MVGALSTMSGGGGSVFRVARNGRCGDTGQPWMAATGTLLQPNLAAAGTGWLFRDANIIYNV